MQLEIVDDFSGNCTFFLSQKPPLHHGPMTWLANVVVVTFMHLPVVVPVSDSNVQLIDLSVMTNPSTELVKNVSPLPTVHCDDDDDDDDDVKGCGADPDVVVVETVVATATSNVTATAKPINPMPTTDGHEEGVRFSSPGPGSNGVPSSTVRSIS